MNHVRYRQKVPIPIVAKKQEAGSVPGKDQAFLESYIWCVVPMPLDRKSWLLADQILTRVFEFSTPSPSCGLPSPDVLTGAIVCQEKQTVRVTNPGGPLVKGGLSEIKLCVFSRSWGLLGLASGLEKSGTAEFGQVNMDPETIRLSLAFPRNAPGTFPRALRSRPNPAWGFRGGTGTTHWGLLQPAQFGL